MIEAETVLLNSSILAVESERQSLVLEIGAMVSEFQRIRGCSEQSKCLVDHDSLDESVLMSDSLALGKIQSLRDLA